MRRVERVERREERVGRRGHGADSMNGLVQGRRDDRRAVEMGGHRSGRTRFGLGAERVVHGVNRGLHAEDREQERQDRGDEPPRATPRQRGRGEECHDRDWPRDDGRAVGGPEMSGS